MKHAFYALIIIQALYELVKLLKCKSIYRHVKVFQKLDKTSKRWYLMAHPWLHVAGDRIVFKPVDMFPCCPGHEFQSNPKAGSMGGVPGQSDYDHRLRFRHPECISLDIKQKREPAHTIRSQLPHTIMMQI